MDPYAITLFSLLGIVALALIVKNTTLSDSISLFLRYVSEYTITWMTLLPYAIFLAGPVVDMVSGQYMYTKASLVGFATLIAVFLFGNNWIAEKMSSIIPSVKTVDATGVSSWNWWGIAALALFGLGGAAMVATPNVLGSSTILRTGISSGGAAILLLMLAGYNILGDTTPVERTIPLDSSSSYGGVTVESVCATPGLAPLQTVFAPTGILLNTSILSAHFFESLDTGNTQGMMRSGITALVAFVIEGLALLGKGCMDGYKYKYGAPFISLALGTGAGAAAYYTMRTFNLESFTQPNQETGVFHPPPSQASPKSDSEKLSTKIVVGPQPETNAPVDDQDQFVCEAYKDGELITSTIVE